MELATKKKAKMTRKYDLPKAIQRVKKDRARYKRFIVTVVSVVMQVEREKNGKKICKIIRI